MSPRSYVTGAFDLLFPALLKFIYTRFMDLKKHNWWEDYVCKNKRNREGRPIVFTDEMCNHLEKHMDSNPDYKPYDINDLYDWFDELSLLKLVLQNDVVKLFKPEAKVFGDLKKIRNDWAHRGRTGEKWGADELKEKEWAVGSIQTIRNAAKNVLRRTDVENHISTHLAKMEYDWIWEVKKPELRSHTELIGWLYNRVVKSVIARNSPVCTKIKNRVIKSFDELKDKAKTPEYVVDYFWNAIKQKSEVGHEIRKHGFDAFEDICAEFADYCYKVKGMR
jgi:hypothetical protein